MKFKQGESGGAMAASECGDVDESVVESDAAFGLAESGVGAGSPPTAPVAGVGSGDVKPVVAPDADSFPRSLGQPKASLELVFADLAAACAVLAEHSLSPLLNDNERASIIAARVRVDEVLSALSQAVA